MNQRAPKYGLKLNDCDTATYVTGPDGKIIADTGIARICKTPDQANMVTCDNIDMARRIAACLNACDGVATDELTALPASFDTLLSDDFMRILKQPAIIATFSDEEAQKFIEAWNAAPKNESVLLPMRHVEVLPPIEVEQIAWLQKANKLHRQVEILYVVDGYTVTVTWDEQPISPDFHGETLREALSKAMAEFDLDAQAKFQDASPRYLMDVQLNAMEASLARANDRWMAAQKDCQLITAQRDELLAALENLLEDDLYAEGEGLISIEDKSDLSPITRAILDKIKGAL
jgi:hypothetical protein